MNDKLIAHMQSPGPKKILALDAVEFAHDHGGSAGRNRNPVAAKAGRGDDFVLADYFDFVSGTSTGAIIAACISIGMKVSDIRTFISTVAGDVR